MSKLTEDYSQKGILIHAIRKLYPVYIRMDSACASITEIHEAIEDVVKAYLLIFMNDEGQKKIAIQLLIMIIESACLSVRGLGYSDNYRAGLYGWILDLEKEYKYPDEHP